MKITDFLEISGGTRIGRNRQRNEDNFFFCRHPSANAVLAAVADGVDGPGYGHLASYICCKYLRQAFDDAETIGEDFLPETLRAVNDRLFRRNVEELRVTPMSCAVAAALFLPDKVVVANAGDSRAYEFLQDETGKCQDHQLSTDHLSGREEAAKIRRHRKRSANSFVACSLGVRHDTEISVNTCDLTPGRRYLLCSNGLLSGLRITRVTAIADKSADAEAMTAELLKTGEKLGCRDDITAISAFALN